MKGEPPRCETLEPMSKDFERLERPLVREGERLRVASWDEALDRAAAGFAAAKQAGGPNAFGLFSCSKTTNELNFLSQKFTRAVIGCNNVDSCNRT
jgi:predicted molibdopterin-dependent oxidoreductase YjgC